MAAPGHPNSFPGGGGPPPNGTHSTGAPQRGPPNPAFIPAPPSAHSQSLGSVFVGVGIALNILAFIVFAARMYTRSFPLYRLRWDDYIIVIAWTFIVTDTALLLSTMPWMFGHPLASITLASVQNSFKLATIAQPLWAWSMAAIKTSVAAMLIRLQQELGWRRFLWAMIALQLLVAVYATFAQLLQCVPLSAAWDLLGLQKKNARCWSAEAIRVNSMCVSVFNIVTDLVFALTPISFLRKVQRPVSERFIIGVLMALGLFASAASTVKMVAADRLGRTDDPSAEGISVGMWACIEETVAFIAACIPCLKSPFQRALIAMGIMSPTTVHSTFRSGPYSQVYHRRGSSGVGKSKGSSNRNSASPFSPAIRMKSIRSNSDTQSEEIILAEEQQGKSRGIWCTREVRLEAEMTKRFSKEGVEQRQEEWSPAAVSMPEEVWSRRSGRDSRDIV